MKRSEKLATLLIFAILMGYVGLASLQLVHNYELIECMTIMQLSDGTPIALQAGVVLDVYPYNHNKYSIIALPTATYQNSNFTLVFQWAINNADGKVYLQSEKQPYYLTGTVYMNKSSIIYDGGNSVIKWSGENHAFEVSGYDICITNFHINDWNIGFP